MTTMEIAAVDVTAAVFAPFGRVFDLQAADPSKPDLVVSHGENYDDCRTLAPLISTNGSLGVTLGTAAPFLTARMERHLHTEEAVFCLSDPIVLVVAPASEATRPSAADLRAFVVRPGTVVVMDKGTWHDACHGIGKPAHYYWLAACRDDLPSAWVDIAGGPVTITATT